MKPLKIYKWDYNNDALGDTVMEKFESLFLLFIKVHDSFCFDAIVSDEDIMALITNNPRFNINLDPDTDMKDPVFMGCWPSRTWKFYQSERLHREIILADMQGRYVLIKVIGF